MNLISLNTFHPAGHGTFFTGELIIEGEGEQVFSWVYDCGSKRRSWLSDLIGFYKKSREYWSHLSKYSENKIDLLCVSHFDADHVNGLEKLLSEFSVDMLVLPYLPLRLRIEIALSIEEESAGDTNVMMFVIDPINFLNQRGYLERISKILFIKGADEQDGPVPFGTKDISPDGKNRDNENIVSTINDLGKPLNPDEDYDLHGQQSSKIRSMEHGEAISYNSLWEFVFYNKEFPKDHIITTKSALKDIQLEIRSVLKRLDLDGKSDQKETTKWRCQIRKIYEKHFGVTPKGRNDISLVLYSNSLALHTLTEIAQFWPVIHYYPYEFYPLNFVQSYVPASENKSGLLLTGDITLLKEDIEKLKLHLGQKRWQRINLMQVPHHGSKNSWEPGNSKLISNDFNVFCVPDFDVLRHHPHIDVLKDLKDKKILFANYSNLVQQNFEIIS